VLARDSLHDKKPVDYSAYICNESLCYNKFATVS